MRRKLLAALMGSFALGPVVGCEIVLVSGHLGKADPRHRDDAVGISDNDDAYPAVGDGKSDGGTEPPQEIE